MRTMRFFVLGLGVIATMAFAACGDDENPSGGANPTNDGGGRGDATADSRPPPTPSEFGLDARPSNKTCKAPPRPPSNATIKLEQVYPTAGAFTFPGTPMAAAQRPGDGSRWYVARRGFNAGNPGRLVWFASANPTGVTEALNLGTVTGSPGFVADGEGGFLGFVFHPQFAQNGKAYVSFTAPPMSSGSMSSVVAEITSTNGGDTFTSFRTLLRFDQTSATNHKGGGLAFGKDGYLYAAFGDGGGGDDTFVKGQTKNGFFAKVLRIDPSKKDAGKEYAVPADNPFVGAAGYEPATFALGFRNPFRISIDRETGELWVGDVGQNRYEEIDLVKAGGNYGWPCREGLHDYITTTANAAKCPSMVGHKDPLVEHTHAIDNPTQANTRSVSGGVVYRGKAIPSLVGSYIYGDYKEKDFFVLSQDLNTGEWKSTPVPDAAALNGSWVGFAEDVDGEVYALSLEDSKMYKVVPAQAQAGTPFPDRLSKTGCMDTAGLVPYGVNAQLWSDGASKQRFIALQDGQKITTSADGDFDFPNGTVLVKTFALGGKSIETRLLVRHDDGGWAGYTYEWLDDGSDAVLLAGAKTKQVGTQAWFYPGRADCAKCHTDVAGKTLGLELGQLNGDFVYESTNRISNQLKTFEHIGLFAAALGKPVDQIVAYPAPESMAGTLETRARAYLHSNCANCHQPNGPGRGDWDLRFATPLATAGICNTNQEGGDLGVAGAKLLVPGDPSKSLVSLRPHALGANRMPPLASSVVDETGLKVVDDWIKSIAACP